SADILSDLVRISRDGGEMDAGRVAQMTDELARTGGAGPVAPAAAAPQPPAFEPLAAGEAEPQVDEFGFAPVQISFDTLIADDEAAGIRQAVHIRFTPKPEL